MASYTPNGDPQAPPIIIHQPTVGRKSQSMTCPSCKANIVTQTYPKPGLGTWLLAGGICLFGCWLGCCLIPFFVDDLQDMEHTCPNCNAHIGTKKLV